MKNNKQIGRAIVLYMESNELKQAEFAQMLDNPVTQGTVSRWITGKGDIDSKNWEQLEPMIRGFMNATYAGEETDSNLYESTEIFERGPYNRPKCPEKLAQIIEFWHGLPKELQDKIHLMAAKGYRDRLDNIIKQGPRNFKE